MNRPGPLGWLRARLAGGARSDAGGVEARLDAAKQLAKAGRLDEAEAALQALVADTAGHAGAQFLLATVLRLRGDATGAGRAFRAVLALEPGHAGAHYGLAQLALDAGEPERAEPLLEQALASDPGFVAAADALGNLFVAAGRVDAALALLGRLPEPVLQDPALLRLRARIAAKQGQPADAERDLRAVLERAPSDAAAAGALGVLLAAREDWAGAADCLEQALGTRAGSAGEWRALARASQQLGRHGRAVELFERVIAAHPDEASARVACAVSLYRCSRFEEAARHLEQVAADAPPDAEVLRKLAMCCVELGRDREALAHAGRALELDPGLLDTHAVQGLALQHLGEFEAAERAYDTLLAAHPEHADARWYRARLLLADARWAPGWADFAWRWDREASAPRPALAVAHWQGEPLAGRRVLLHGEQGLGDEIMFASCVPDMIAAGADCTLTCDARLAGLFARSFPQARVSASDPVAVAAQDRFDLQAATGDLPRHFRSRAEDFPRHEGYLRPDPARVRHWREVLARLGPGPRVGVSWRGGTPLTRSGVRSLGLSGLAPVLQCPGVTWISLQYGKVDEELADAFETHGAALHHWPEAIADYDETAALVSALDLVVTVCTALVHLSGALGREAWVLTPAAAEWRYGRRGESMPWYPSIRLFRQSHAGDWSAPVEAVRAGLAARFAGRK